MTCNAQEQLRSIQSMMSNGQRSVHLERHSLLLFGLGGGMLCVFTEKVITLDRFPDVMQAGLMFLLWLGFWLGGLSFIDYALTRRLREKRAETLPFAQAQITRAWWMLLTVGTLGTFATFFFGGGSMTYTLWTVLLGLGIYLFGLFSRPMIEWIGLATILLGIAAPAAGLPYGATRWLAASAFLIGMPLAGWLTARIDDRKLPTRLAGLAVWVALVLLPVFVAQRMHHVPAPASPTVTQHDPLAMTGEKVIRIEAGSKIPLRVDLDSSMVGISPMDSLDITLHAPIEIALDNGIPDGRYRIADGPWHEVKEGLLWLRIEKLSPRIEQNRPVIRAKAKLSQLDMQNSEAQ